MEQSHTTDQHQGNNIDADKELHKAQQLKTGKNSYSKLKGPATPLKKSIPKKKFLSLYRKSD